MSRLVFDLETNGLDMETMKVHCIAIGDMDTGEVVSFNGEDIKRGIEMLENADETYAHNGISFDYPVINELYGFKCSDKHLDTIVCSRLIWTDLKDRDFRFVEKNPEFPKNLIGSHSLGAWGARMGFPKDDYAKRMKEKGLDPWAEWNQEMEDYCVIDVKVTMELLKKIDAKEWSKESIDLEHKVARIIKLQEDNGITFDTESAVALYAELSQEKANIERELEKFFGSYYVNKGSFVPKSDNKRFGYVKGVEFNKIKLVDFNPASNDHISNRLQKLYNWKPAVFTPSGKPKVDEAVLKTLKYPPIKLLLKYQLINKRIGQVAEGKQAWLKVENNGKIHGRVTTNGAVTGRMTHSSPNLAQTPAVYSPYGEQCRALFQPRPNWKLVGADASGLELRCLAHYMGRWDKGEYADLILNGDIHTHNQKAAGLPTRDNAKTFIYALLYGAGVQKIGSIINKGAGAGKKLQAKFFKSIPALANLKNGVENKVKANGSLKGLDGRLLHIRSSHSALNTLLQSAGALIMKKALVIFYESMEKQYKHGTDYAFCLNVHDEIQVECKPELEAIVGNKLVESMREAGEFYEFRCPIDGEWKSGSSWKDTH